MTIEEAAKILEYPVYKWSMDWDEREDGLEYCDALKMAVAALRAQQTPAKLDRSRWEGCVECYEEHQGCQVCVHAARREELEPCKSCVKGYQDSEGEEHTGFRTASYCPFCGRPLTEEAWAELERRVNGGTTD